MALRVVIDFREQLAIQVEIPGLRPVNHLCYLS